MRACPVHAAALQPRLDHQFVRTFNATAADWKASRLEAGVLDLIQAFGQIVQRRVARLACRGGIGGRWIGRWANAIST